MNEPRKGRRLSQKRLKLWEDDPHCRYCGWPVTYDNSKLDHVIPRSRGGTNKYGNLVLCCYKCNQRKADLTPLEVLHWALQVVATANAGCLHVNKPRRADVIARKLLAAEAAES